jgi:Pyruvate/2-oxoacid:ferredoxin oxidoreductase gamma subunit
VIISDSEIIHPKVTEMVGLDLVVGLTGVVSRRAIEVAVSARAPKGTEEMNSKSSGDWT